MATPTFTPIVSTQTSWDANINDALGVLFNGPKPVHIHSGDESDLEATYPAASFSNCIIFIQHTVNGRKLYFSDGTSWAAV